MGGTFITKKLMQPSNGVALRLVVDIYAHQIVVAGKVGIECVDGHGRLKVRAG